MASFPAKLFLTRALSQLRCLHLPVRYKTHRLHGKIQSMVGNTQPLAQLLGSRWFHCTTFALAQKTVTGPATKKDPVSAARERRAQTVRVIGEEDADEQLMTKAQAESLAKQRMLKLVLLEDDTEGTHPTYQLMTGKQLAEERNRLQELKKLHKKKEAKALRVTSRISKHDLETKTRKVVEWLQKGQEVKLTIKNRTPDNDKAALDVFKYMTDQTRDDATVSQAQKSAHELVYVLKPSAAEPPKTPKTKPFTMAELREQRGQDT